MTRAPSWARSQPAGSGGVARGMSRSCRLVEVGLKSLVDECHDCVDDRMDQSLLPGDELHELVGTLDIGRAVLQSARGRRRAHERLRRGGVLLERHEILRLAAKLDAQI